MISKNIAINFLLTHNPHWHNKPFEKSILREKLDEINLLNKSKTVVSIIGPRRSGKSVLVYPFNFREYLRAHKIDFKIGKTIEQTAKLNFIQKTTILGGLKKYLQTGGYPELLKIKKTIDKKNYLTEYIRSVIYKDIVPRFHLKDSLTLEKLMWYLINNIGALYSYNSLSKIIDSNENTTLQYLFYLEQAYLNFECIRFSHSLKKKIKSQKKSYLVDHGLRQIFDSKLFDDNSKIVENLVFNTLKQKMNVGYFIDKNELDFVGFKLYQDLYLVNVSYTNDLDEREFKVFGQFQVPSGYKVRKIIITDDLLDVEARIEKIPLWLWLLQS